VKLLVRLTLVALAGYAGYLLWKRFMSGDDTYDEPPTPRRVHERAELSPEEWAAGSDDPVAQASAILTESDERARLTRDDDGIERRRSEDTVEP
jgi:hypothetical protein